jgi:hypothetical protein
MPISRRQSLAVKIPLLMSTRLPLALAGMSAASAEGKPGAGATFSFTLPPATGEAVPA